jgi:ATP-dependent DNA helicase RecG
MGDLFGEAQSGMSTFKIADPLRDEALNEKAREIADRILAEDPELEAPANAPLKRALGIRYARALELFRVG